MSLKSYRLWYFEAHLPSGKKEYVGADGKTISAETALQSAYVGLQDEAHTEANRRCDAYDACHAVEARAMSFSPTATLASIL